MFFDLLFVMFLIVFFGVFNSVKFMLIILFFICFKLGNVRGFKVFLDMNIV